MRQQATLEGRDSVCYFAHSTMGQAAMRKPLPDDGSKSEIPDPQRSCLVAGDLDPCHSICDDIVWDPLTISLVRWYRLPADIAVRTRCVNFMYWMHSAALLGHS